MPRWKNPPQKSSPYISPDGYQKLQCEYDAIWKRRAEVTMALSAAAAEGDRSENAEYIYRKKELREIDARIRYLQSRMPQLNIVKEVRDIEYIYFGAKLTLLDHHGKKLFVQIVGADELNSNEYISVDSPLARALLNKTINDVISLDVQGEITTYEVIKIEYDNEITIKV